MAYPGRPTGEVGASPPSRAAGGAVLARVKALRELRPAAQAPSAAWTRAALGAWVETRATAEGRSAGGSSSGRQCTGLRLYVLLFATVVHSWSTPLSGGSWSPESLAQSASWSRS